MAVLADRQAFQKTREMRGFLNFTWLGPGAKHMHHACAREMHVIGRHHAWVDRSRSFGSPRPRSGFAPWGRFMGGCEAAQVLGSDLWRFDRLLLLKGSGGNLVFFFLQFWFWEGARS